MALSPRFLADKSALVRAAHPQAQWFAQAIVAGEVARCSMVDLEIYFSARNHADFLTIKSQREAGFHLVPTEQADFDRAVEVIGHLARRGHHRAVSLPDLLVAAVAERAGLDLVHYEEDFEFVEQITGQPTRWLAPPGSL